MYVCMYVAMWWKVEWDKKQYMQYNGSSGSMAQYDRNRWCGCVCEEQSIWIQREEREGTAVDHFKDLCVGRYSHLRDLKLHLLGDWTDGSV